VDVLTMHNATREQLVEFEHQVQLAWERGELPYLLHLAGGNEGPLIDIFKQIHSGDWIVGSHRSHYHWLLAGGSPEELMQRIHSGQSMFLFKRSLNFLTSAILAGNCCIAAGIALALKDSGSQAAVWCFLGDGATDEGHFYEAVSFVQGRDLPCTFIIEDNDQSVGVSVSVRFGSDHRREWGPHVIRYRYVPSYPHAGSGCKHHITFQPKKNPWATLTSS
jgi:pyruvate dehydrogenase E1 component alpha subunit